jgi:hypothetical protein
MTDLRAILLMLCTAVVPTLSFAQEPKTEAPVAPWNIYELKLVQIQDEPGTPAAYQVGYSVFRTRKALFEWLSPLKQGNVIRWDRGSDIPLADDPLGGSGGYEALQRFCEERGIKLETVPRP